jgi:tetratricopeptide (TPR) repeat protein
MHLALTTKEALASAERLESAGEYVRAVQALADLWKGPGFPVDRRDSLTDDTLALLLLRAGSLTGWIGSTRQIAGAQEQAKDLLLESSRAFAQLGDEVRIAEAEKCLAVCYWREGAYDEALAYLGTASKRVAEESDLGLVIALNSAFIVRCKDQDQQAMAIYGSIAAAVDRSDSHAVRGMFHNGFAFSLRRAGELDRALIEYAAASYHFEKAGHRRFTAKAEQNLAAVYLHLHQFDDSHVHLDRAEKVLLLIRDDGALAELLELRAQVFLAERRPEDAEVVARQAVSILQRGDEHALMVDTLATHARALVNLQRDDEALDAYVRAYKVAAARVSAERAAQVALDLVVKLISDVSLHGKLTYDAAMDLFEKNFIRASLELTGGSQKETALRLAMKQQTLSHITTKRFPELNTNPNRKPRRASIIKMPVSSKEQKPS